MLKQRKKGKDGNVTEDQRGIRRHRCSIALEIHEAQEDILRSQGTLLPTLHLNVLWTLSSATLSHTRDFDN